MQVFCGFGIALYLAKSEKGFVTKIYHDCTLSKDDEFEYEVPENKSCNKSRKEKKIILVKILHACIEVFECKHLTHVDRRCEICEEADRIHKVCKEKHKVIRDCNRENEWVYNCERWLEITH